MSSTRYVSLPMASFVVFALLFLFLIGVLFLVIYFWTHQAVQIHVVHVPTKMTSSSPYPNGFPPILSPSLDADIETILHYLLERGTFLNKSEWSDEVLRALRDPTSWIRAGGPQPTFYYPRGKLTIESLLIYYDTSTGQWNLRAYS